MVLPLLTIIYWLVVEPTPLKNDGVRQLGWWHSQYMEKEMFQTTNQSTYIFLYFPIFIILLILPTIKHDIVPWQTL